MNKLSPQMRNVLQSLSLGNTYKETACLLSIKRDTVRKYAYMAMSRLKARTVIQAVVIFSKGI